MAWLVLGPVERKKKGGEARREGGREKGRKNGGRVGLAGGERGQGFVKTRVSFFILYIVKLGIQSFTFHHFFSS